MSVNNAITTYSLYVFFRSLRVSRIFNVDGFDILLNEADDEDLIAFGESLLNGDEGFVLDVNQIDTLKKNLKEARG